MDHSLRCQVCAQAYCVRCAVGSQCRTCHQAAAGRVAPTSTVPAAPGIAPPLYRWRRAENRDFVIYLGQRWLGQAVIVTGRAGELVYHRKTSVLHRLAKLLRGG